MFRVGKGLISNNWYQSGEDPAGGFESRSAEKRVAAPVGCWVLCGMTREEGGVGCMRVNDEEGDRAGG